MRVNLALRDVAAARGNDVFDRILEGDDMVVAVAVYFIDQRGERRAFAAAHGAGDKHQAVVVLGQKFDLLGKPEFIHRADMIADDAKYKVTADALANDAGAESADAGGIRKIHIATCSELFLLRGREEAHGESVGLFCTQRCGLLPDRLKNSITSPDWRSIDA